MIKINEIKRVFQLDIIGGQFVEEQVFEGLAQALKEVLDDDAGWHLDVEKNSVEIWKCKLIVNDGELSDNDHQIELSKARWYELDYEVGEDFYYLVSLIDLSGDVLKKVENRFWETIKGIGGVTRRT